ncbi:hypothetical protein ACFL43_07045 [Thermodesulfobacteriota bacterium]
MKRRIVLLMLMALGGLGFGCAAGPEVREETGGAEFVPLIQYYVVCSAGSSAFVERYCEATQAPLVDIGGTWSAGPFLSAYEAGWLASRIPRARVKTVTPFPAGEESIERGLLIAMLGTAFNRIGLEQYSTRSRKIGEHLILQLQCRYENGVATEGYYWISPSGARSIARKPRSADAYQSSFGAAVVDRQGAPLFLSMIDGPRGSSEKQEDLVLWRFDAAGNRKTRATLAAATRFAAVRDAEGIVMVDLRVIRLAATDEGLVIKRYAVRAEGTGADPDTSLKGSEAWRDGKLEADALRFVAHEALDEKLWKWPKR